MDPRITFISLFSVSFLTCYIGTAKLNEPRVIVPVVVELQPTKEEILLPAPTSKSAPKSGVAQEEAEGRLLVFEGERPLLALQKVYDAEWLQGEPTWISKGQPYELKGAINQEMLPASTKAWVGQSLRLYKADGSFCRAEVTGLSLFGEVISYTEEQPGLAKEAWELAQNIGGVRVVGELSINECRGALLAQIESLPALELSSPQEINAKLREEILVKTRSLSLYKKIQQEFDSQRAEAKFTEQRWENLYGASPEVKAFSFGGEQFAFVSIDAGEGCGSFGESLFALWRINDLTLLSQSRTWAKPELLFDLNQDGTFEFIEEEQLFQLNEGEFERTTDVIIPDDGDGCGC